MREIALPIVAVESEKYGTRMSMCSKTGLAIS